MRVGFLGAGLIAGYHTRALRASGHGGPGNPDGAFIRAAQEGRPAFPDFAVALRAHAVVDALYRSAAEGGLPQALPF